ncbi:MAG: hypothetical protein ABL999_10005 [Pyrinomonadaceae bacterium]
MNKFLVVLLALVLFSGIAMAQPRPVEKTPSIPANAPSSYEARYEGGLFGASTKETGDLTFDDANERLVFKRDGKEMFSIPYTSLIMVYPDSKDSVPQAGKVISHIPLPGAGLAGLMNKSTKYANITFEDPDIQANGTASFRFKDKDKLISFINQLGVKAKMKQRGDAFYKPRNTSTF